jgi:hypothetical protein
MPDPLAKEPRCTSKPSPWSTRKLRAAGSPNKNDNQASLLAVDLLSLNADMAGAPIQMCRIALTTRAGVFVEDDTSTCQGVIGPDSAIQTRTLGLSWLEVAPYGRIARLDIEQVVHGRMRSTLLCGVGPSGVPSCAGNYPLLCMNSDAALVTLELKVEAGFVHLTPSSKPPSPDLQSYLDCDEVSAPMPLSFP